MWAIANDEPERLKKARQELGLDYDLLVDPGAEVTRRYGILNDGDPRGRAIPHPSIVIVDGEGLVRWLHSDPDYKRRPPVARLLEALDAMGSSKTERSAP